MHNLFFRFRESLGMKVIKAVQRDSDAVTHAAIDMIVTLLCVRSCFVYIISS